MLHFFYTQNTSWIKCLESASNAWCNYWIHARIEHTFCKHTLVFKSMIIGSAWNKNLTSKVAWVLFSTRKRRRKKRQTVQKARKSTLNPRKECLSLLYFPLPRWRLKPILHMVNGNWVLFFFKNMELIHMFLLDLVKAY
jgi:hypothetical protein